MTALASRLAAYGPSSLSDVREIAKAAVLNCTQTMIFVAETINARAEITASKVTVESATIGMHGLVEAKIDGRKYVLDGSTGTVFLASINKLFRPEPKHVSIIPFFDETDGRLADLLGEMTRSVSLGLFTPKHITSRTKL